MRVPKIVSVLVVLILAATGLALGGALTTAKSFSVACVSTGFGTALTATGVSGYNAVYCQNMSATSVYLGGADVTSSNAPCISTATATCPKSDFGWDVSLGAGPRCLAASGTVTIKCLSGR